MSQAEKVMEIQHLAGPTVSSKRTDKKAVKIAIFYVNSKLQQFVEPESTLYKAGRWGPPSYVFLHML